MLNLKYDVVVCFCAIFCLLTFKSFRIGHWKYSATTFIERNTDKLAADLLSFGASSSNEIICSRFQTLAAIRVEQQTKLFTGRRNAGTVVSTFRNQLNSLLANIHNTRTRYIRCIKPNNERQPLVMDHKMTMRQISSACLVTAIQINRDTFPNRLLYKIVWHQFQCLLPSSAEVGTTEMKKKSIHLLERLLEGKRNLFVCGKTKGKSFVVSLVCTLDPNAGDRRNIETSV